MHEYDGDERRKDLTSVLNERLKNTIISVDKLEKSVDTLIKAFPALPCPEHKNRIDFLERLIVGVVILGIVFGVWIKAVAGKM